MTIERSGPILCFGEVLLRLSTPSGSRLTNASCLAPHVAGAEANVAAVLAQTGHDAQIVTVLPHSGLGDFCEGEIRRLGVSTDKSLRANGRLGLYFLEPGAAGSARVIYDRQNSAFAENADGFDWAELASSASWFHLSGINLALGGKPAAGALEAVGAMAAAGVPISFDVNHRHSLWEGRSNEDVARVKSVIALTDLLFASPQDLSRVLQSGPASQDSATQAAFGAFDKLKYVASTSRAADRLSARFDGRDFSHETEFAPLGNVLDRIGSGDAFAGAVIDGLIRNLPFDQCARHGLAAAVMKHSISGDRWIGRIADLEAFDPFAAGEVVR